MKTYIILLQITLLLILLSCKSSKPADLCGIYQSKCKVDVLLQNKLKSDYRLELNEDSTMRISTLPFNKLIGNGMWHDNGKVIILDLNDLSYRDSKKVLEGLTGIKSLEGAYIILDKKGRDKLSHDNAIGIIPVRVDSSPFIIRTAYSYNNELRSNILNIRGFTIKNMYRR